MGWCPAWVNGSTNNQAVYGLVVQEAGSTPAISTILTNDQPCPGCCKIIGAGAPKASLGEVGKKTNTLDQDLSKVPVAIRKIVASLEPRKREEVLRVYMQYPDSRGYRGEVRCLPLQGRPKRKPIRHAV